MNTVLLAVTALAVVVMAAFIIPFVIELRRTVVSLRKSVEENLNPALDELRQYLKTTKSVADNLENITSDVREFTGSVNEVGRKVRAVSELVGDVGSSAAIRAVSLRAGIQAAVAYLLAHILGKGERK